MIFPKICAVLALLSSLLITSAIAQSPLPTPAAFPRVPARRANSDTTSTSTKTTKTENSTPSTTSKGSTSTSHSKTSTSTATSLSTSTSTPSATSTSTPAPSSSSSSLSPGAIAGIAVGVVAVVALLAVGVFIYIWRMRKSRQIHRQSMNPHGTLGGMAPVIEPAPTDNMYKNVNDESSRSTDVSPTAEGDVEAYGALGAPLMSSSEEGQSKLDPAVTRDARGPSVEIDGKETPAVSPKIGIPQLPNSPIELGTSP